MVNEHPDCFDNSGTTSAEEWSIVCQEIIKRLVSLRNTNDSVIKSALETRLPRQDLRVDGKCEVEASENEV
jgi:hypothetical protein